MGKSSGGTRASASNSPKGLTTKPNSIIDIASNLALKRSNGVPYMEVDSGRGAQITFSRKNDGVSSWPEIEETASIYLSSDRRSVNVTVNRSQYERVPFQTGDRPESYRVVPTGNETQTFSVNDNNLEQKIKKFLNKK